MSRGRLGRYAIDQLDDWFFERGFATLLIGGFLVWTAYISFPRQALPGIDLDTLRDRAIDSTLGPLAFFGTLIAVNGIVSNDRKQGYYRFLFAKPVSIVRYYAQAFAVHGLGFLAASVVIVAALSAAIGRSLQLAPVAYCALIFVSFGGIVFLASTLVRFDWSLGGVVWGLGQIIHSLANRAEELIAMGRPIDLVPAAWSRWVAPLLPPVADGGEVLAALVVGDPVPERIALWLAGYGVVCFVIGLFVLRRRALAD